MCRRITCPTCSKPSWVGCGLHVESNDVLGLVPLLERCQCKKEYSTRDSLKMVGVQLSNYIFSLLISVCKSLLYCDESYARITSLHPLLPTQGSSS
jgi:hypothetical protein